MRLLWGMALLLVGALVVGCSSDAPTQTRLVVTTSDTLAPGKSLAGIGMTITLPNGVAPPFDTAGQVDGNRLVTASGVAASGGLAVAAVHLTTGSGQPAQLSLAVASKVSGGFGVGETMILNLNLTNGVLPKSSDFGIAEFQAVGLDGQAVSGIQATVTVPKILW